MSKLESAISRILFWYDLAAKKINNRSVNGIGKSILFWYDLAAKKINNRSVNGIGKSIPRNGLAAGIVGIILISSLIAVSPLLRASTEPMDQDFAGEENKNPTTLTLDYSPLQFSEGDLVVFTGRLSIANTTIELMAIDDEYDDEYGISDATIEIYEYDEGGNDNQMLTSGVTDVNGYFSITWIVYCDDIDDPCTFQFFAAFAGTDEYEASESPIYSVEVDQAAFGYGP